MCERELQGSLILDLGKEIKVTTKPDEGEPMTKEKWYRCPKCKLMLSPDKGKLTKCPFCGARITEMNVENVIAIKIGGKTFGKLESP